MATALYNIGKIIIIFTALCQAQINDTANHGIPALYKFDHYEDCIKRNVSESPYPAKYSMVLVQIQPDNSSSVWQQIAEKSENRVNYRHDHLFRGVCLERCQEFRGREAKSYNGLLNIEQTQEFKNFFTRPVDHLMRDQFQQDIHECVNREYMQQYNLSTKTFVIYSIDPKDQKEKDLYLYITVFLISSLILLNIFSTLYDAKLKSQQAKPDDKYYEIKHSDIVNRLLTSFSLIRNYKRLVVPNNSDIGRDLAFLDGFRSILCLLIIGEHFLMLEFAQLENPETFEYIWSLLSIKMFINALVWLEFFFVLSGLFLCVKFENAKYITPKSSLKQCSQVFVRLLVSRYLRLLPSLLFLIIYFSNIPYYQEDGSFSRFLLETNCIACRNGWWQNLLMINNYFIKNSCMMHTWYLAADFHLYALFLIVLIIMAKFPNLKVVILSGIAIFSAALNFGLNYFLKLDSVFMLVPESYRYAYFRNIDTAKYLYFSSYTNINSFLVGIVCGYIYMKYLRKNNENKKRLSGLLKNLPYIGWPCILAILYLGAMIFSHTETTIGTAAYGILLRHIGIPIVAVMIIVRGMCNGGGIFKAKFFRLFSRISFQFYLWQLVLMLYLVGGSDETITFNVASTIEMYPSLLFGTAFIAFVVALAVEYPIAEIIGLIDIEKKIKPMKTD